MRLGSVNKKKIEVKVILHGSKSSRVDDDKCMVEKARRSV